MGNHDEQPFASYLDVTARQLVLGAYADGRWEMTKALSLSRARAESEYDVKAAYPHKLVMERPDLKVIFTSGYSAELIGPEFEMDNEHAFLSKPYHTGQLAKTIAAQFQPCA